jgi:hypothetical protein
MNFATQSLLTAVGVGAQKALAASAAINWMLKDGISRLVRMSVATQWGDAFDSDLKRFRYGSSLVYAGLLSCEFLAPFRPGSFLLLASISNVGRAVGGVGWTCMCLGRWVGGGGWLGIFRSKFNLPPLTIESYATAPCAHHHRARQIGLTTFVSTQPAFQQALCASGKMADLASKTQVG